MSLLEATAMVTYGVREFKAKVSEVLDSLADGEEVVITKRGKPCGKLTTVADAGDGKLPLSALRELLPDLPDATDEDFLEAKKIWEPRVPDDL